MPGPGRLVRAREAGQVSKTTSERLAVKTPEAACVHMLQEEFRFSPRVSRELLSLAQEMLIGSRPASTVRPGQVRLVVTRLTSPFGPPLARSDKVEVTLTVAAGSEDAEVKVREGAEKLRQGRILRLIDEALDQGGVLTQEDLARALGVDVRTIRRDVRALKAEGQRIDTRAQLKGVGRGQSHKVRLLQLWLDRQGYDHIARAMHHSPPAIQRYVSTFLRVVALKRRGSALEEMAFVTQSSLRLVRDYLSLYETTLTQAHRREKLEEELARVTQPTPAHNDAEKKTGASR